MSILYSIFAIVGLAVILRGLYLFVKRKVKAGLATTTLGFVVLVAGFVGVVSVWMNGWSEYTAEPDSEFARAKFAAAFDFPPNMLFDPNDSDSTWYEFPDRISNIWYGTIGFQDYVAYIRFDFASEADLAPLLEGWTLAENPTLAPKRPHWWLESLAEDMTIYTRSTGADSPPMKALLVIDHENRVAFWAEI